MDRKKPKMNVLALLTLAGVLNMSTEPSGSTFAAKLDQFEEPEDFYQEEQLVEIDENKSTGFEEVGSNKPQIEGLTI